MCRGINDYHRTGAGSVIQSPR